MPKRLAKILALAAVFMLLIGGFMMGLLLPPVTVVIVAFVLTMVALFFVATVFIVTDVAYTAPLFATATAVAATGVGRAVADGSVAWFVVFVTFTASALLIATFMGNDEVNKLYAPKSSRRGGGIAPF
jgi:hypothetical protein